MIRWAALTALLLTAACSTPSPTHTRVAHVRYDRGCDMRLDTVRMATSPGAATESVRAYLGCVASHAGAPPMDLSRNVSTALAANPYPRTRRMASVIHGRFFDKKLLKKLPETRAQLGPYLELLEAQTLRARAERDERFIKAAENRAKSLDTLGRVLDTLEGQS
jgi:hypothetical protein